MKKLLILILITLLALLSFGIILEGTKIGSIEILGIKGIQKENKMLDETIKKAGKLAEKDFLIAQKEVKENTKKLKQEKENYEELTTVSQEGDIENSKQIEKYEVETLWVKLGNHSTSEGVDMDIKITSGTNEVKDSYNLNFTVTGSYISITDFISSIENDSTLGFKIENFKMVPSNSQNLKATFVCKDILIKDVTASPVQVETNEKDDTNNEKQTEEKEDTKNEKQTEEKDNTKENINTKEDKENN